MADGKARNAAANQSTSLISIGKNQYAKRAEIALGAKL
jgi:hypothetical protein